ncbi:hypothetical protein ACFOZ7_07595 [Natribaculum luteum]|uniref:Uncharacterized protein n=1 Tax=Natribaculum luteum TaxID=1586232 RepID=A0ABD5NY43_9EURY|nr:hypothetical protein [Natribaculum luteum]
MATSSSLPAIDRCIDLYLTAYGRFGDDPFSSASIADYWTSSSESSDANLEQLLSLLVAYGLVERTDDDQYRVRCSPDDDVSRWNERAKLRAETLRRAVTAARDDGRAATESEAEPLEYDGASFASVFVTEGDDVDAVATTVANVFDSSERVAGVVLRSSGDAAGHVQQLADSLCDRADPPGRSGSLEKESSDLVGEHKDDLEFRLFLRTTRA